MSKAYVKYMLLAQKLPESESCRGIVRVGEAMDISPGDYIVIAGKKEHICKGMESCGSDGVNMKVKMLMLLRLYGWIASRQEIPG